MRTIFKYTLDPGETTLDLPAKAEILTAGKDNRGKACIWCLVNPDSPTEKKTFVIRGTGQVIENNLWYIKSFKDNPFIWHVFEKL